MKQILLLGIGLLSIISVNGQSLLFTSEFGGDFGNGAISLYNVANNSSEIFSLEGNPQYGMNFVVDDFDFGDIPNGLFYGSDDYLYGTNYLASGIVNGRGIFYRVNPNTMKYEILHVFAGKSGPFTDDTSSAFKDLSGPAFNVFEYTAGVFYGIALEGGDYGEGGIWKYELATGTYQVIGSFNENSTGITPRSPLFKGPNDDIYGILEKKSEDTSQGHLYKVDVADGTLSFVDALSADAGFTIFNPVGDIVYLVGQNKILGVKKYTSSSPSTYGGGIFEYNFSTSSVTHHTLITQSQTSILGSLSSGLVAGNDGFYYMTTRSGGAHDYGTLVQYNAQSHTMIKVVDFQQRTIGMGMKVVGAKIYGSYEAPLNGEYAVWEYDVSTSNLNNIVQVDDATIGSNTKSYFALNNGIIYAHNMKGALSNMGTFFTYNISSGHSTVLDHCNSPNGRNIVGDIFDLGNNKFLCLTQLGGEGRFNYNEAGTLMMYDYNADTFTKISDFEVGEDRQGYTEGQFTKADNGLVYFVKYNSSALTGSSDPVFLVYSFNPSDKSVNEVTKFNRSFANQRRYTPALNHYSSNKLAWASKDSIWVYNLTNDSYLYKEKVFQNNDSGYFRGKMTFASDEKLYGTTRRYTDDIGDQIVIYSFDPTNFQYHVEYTFPAEVYETGNQLTEYNGKLYGATYSGGDNDEGYIFSYELSNSQFNTEYSFDAAVDGGGFLGGWTLFDNNLYATSYAGGANGNGTIVKFDPALSSNQLSVLTNLSNTNGRSYQCTPLVYDTILGIENNEAVNKIKLYPNPTNDVIYLDMEVVDKIEIFNSIGQKVLEKLNSSEVNLKNLNSGLYIVKVTSQGESFLRKVIKE